MIHYLPIGNKNNLIINFPIPALVIFSLTKTVLGGGGRPILNCGLRYGTAPKSKNDNNRWKKGKGKREKSVLKTVRCRLLGVGNGR